MLQYILFLYLNLPPIKHEKIIAFFDLTKFVTKLVNTKPLICKLTSRVARIKINGHNKAFILNVCTLAGAFTFIRNLFTL